MILPGKQTKEQAEQILAQLVFSLEEALQEASTPKVWEYCDALRNNIASGEIGINGILPNSIDLQSLPDSFEHVYTITNGVNMLKRIRFKPLLKQHFILMIFCKSNNDFSITQELN